MARNLRASSVEIPSPRLLACAWVSRVAAFPRSWTLLLPLCFAPALACGPGVGSHAARDVVVIGMPGRGDGSLQQPRGIEALADDSCLIVDRSGRVQRFGANGEFVASWWLPEWSEGQPIDLTLTPWNTVLVADTHYGRVLEYDLAGQEIRRIGEQAGLMLVRGITVGHDETIYVADYGEYDRIHRFARDGDPLGTFGQQGEGPGEFLRPEGMTTGADGGIYVVDCGNHRVQRFTATGEFVGQFGTAGEADGQFLFPFDIAAGSDGTLYVVDFRGNRVQRFSADGEFLGGVGGAGREPGTFATPRGIAALARPDGDVLYVADTNNHRVQRFRWVYDQ